MTFQSSFALGSYLVPSNNDNFLSNLWTAGVQLIN